MILDWQTLEVEYLASNRTDAWMRLVREVRAAGKPVGVVALVGSEQSAAAEIEHADAIAGPRGPGAAPQALAEAIERAIERSVPDRSVPDPPPPPQPPSPPPAVIDHYLFAPSAAIPAD